MPSCGTRFRHFLPGRWCGIEHPARAGSSRRDLSPSFLDEAPAGVSPPVGVMLRRDVSEVNRHPRCTRGARPRLTPRRSRTTAEPPRSEWPRVADTLQQPYAVPSPCRSVDRTISMPSSPRSATHVGGANSRPQAVAVLVVAHEHDPLRARAAGRQHTRSSPTAGRRPMIRHRAVLGLTPALIAAWCARCRARRTVSAATRAAPRPPAGSGSLLDQRGPLAVGTPYRAVAWPAACFCHLPHNLLTVRQEVFRPSGIRTVEVAVLTHTKRAPPSARPAAVSGHLQRPVVPPACV